MDTLPPFRFVTGSLHVDFLKPTARACLIEIRGRLLIKNAAIAPCAKARWAMRVQGPFEGDVPSSHTIHFEIAAEGSVGKVTEKAAFIVPC